MIVRRPDPWDDECPDAYELSRAQLLEFLEAARSITCLTPWEDDFCSSLRSRILGGKSPTHAQRDVLNRGLLNKLWREDPDLWR